MMWSIKDYVTLLEATIVVVVGVDDIVVVVVNVIVVSLLNVSDPFIFSYG